MSTRKIDLASRALQIFLEHSLASSAGVASKIRESSELGSSGYIISRATRIWIEFLQKAQSSWSSYILAALDRIDDHVCWAMRSWRNRNRLEEGLLITLAELSRRSALYLVNAHLQGGRGDIELAHLWEAASRTYQSICLAYTRRSLVGEGVAQLCLDEASIFQYTFSINKYSLKDAIEHDVRMREATDEAVRNAWKQVGRNCRIVRVCRHISALYRSFHKCFVFSAKSTVAELSHTCGRSKHAVECYWKSAMFLTSASTEKESCIATLYRRASENMSLVVDLRNIGPTDSVEVHQVTSNAETIAEHANTLSDLFAALRKYEAQAGSTPLAQRAARREQLAAVLRELEDIVSTLFAMPLYASPKSTPNEDEEMDLEMAISSVTRSLRACAEEVSADEKRLRYFTQQADAVDVAKNPAHRRILICWTRAAEYLRQARAAAAEEGGNVDNLHENTGNTPSSHLLGRSDFMAMLAEGTFADAARMYQHEIDIMSRSSTPALALAGGYCGQAAEAFVSAGIASIEGIARRTSFEHLPERAARFEKLARQCVRAMEFHEHNPAAPSASEELLSLAVEIQLAFTRKISAGSEQNVPAYTVWTAQDIDELCVFLNEGCYLQTQLDAAQRDCPVEPALQQRAQWIIFTALICGRKGSKLIQGKGLGHNELRLLKLAVYWAKLVERCVFESPGSVEVEHSPAVDSALSECVQHQIACERILQALRAFEQGCTVESQLWEKAAARWQYPPRGEITSASVRDPLLRCIGDQLAQRARQLTKSKDDRDKIGSFATHAVTTEEDLGQLAPHVRAIKDIARATKDSLLHADLAQREKRRSPLWMLHTHASLQFQNVADYKRGGVEVAQGHRGSADDDKLLAALALQSAQHFASAAGAATSTTDYADREEIIELYTIAGGILEMNPYAKEQAARKGQPFSTEDALRVAEKAGQRYAAAARAMVNGDMSLCSAWETAARATALLVSELEQKRGNKRRTRVLTEDYSDAALTQADELAAAAAAMEKEHFTYMDLCSSAEESGAEDGH